MSMDQINVAKWFHAKSPSFPRCKEGVLPLLNFSNLTCMILSLTTFLFFYLNVYYVCIKTRIKTLLPFLVLIDYLLFRHNYFINTTVLPGQYVNILNYQHNGTYCLLLGRSLPVYHQNKTPLYLQFID